MGKALTIRSKKECIGVSSLGFIYNYLPVKHLLNIIVQFCDQCNIDFDINHISNEKLTITFDCSLKQLKSIKNALIINFNEYYDFE